jgi:hypothetical protein
MQIRKLAFQNFGGAYMSLSSLAFFGPARGIKNILKQGFQSGFEANPKKYKLNERISSSFAYIYRSDKKRGVEPGFEATKDWKIKDETKLDDPQHTFHALAKQYLKMHLNSEAIRKALNAIKKEPSDLEQDPALYRLLIQFPSVREILISHLMMIHPKFKKKHYFKLDYNDPTGGGSPSLKKVWVDIERAKPGRFGQMGKWIHQWSTVGTRKEKNEGAILEALANDLYTVLGFGGQKLEIVISRYADGYPKLLLSSTHIQGSNGELFDTLEGKIHDGVIPNNALPGLGGIKYPIRNLGVGKATALLMGDRDKIGDKGENIGYVVEKGEALLKNFDPGKSMEAAPPISQAIFLDLPANPTVANVLCYLFQQLMAVLKFLFFGQTDRMLHRNIHSDFSMEDSLGSFKDYFQGGYKNFTIFDDTDLDEKMEGLRLIRDRWPDVEEVFARYLSVWSEKDFDFTATLTNAWDRLNARKEYFISVFKDRLPLLNDPRRKQLFELIENMERLTSRTVDNVGSGSDFIPLKHLRVLPGTRKEWNIRLHDDGTYTLYFIGKTPQEITRVSDRIYRYFKQNNGIGLIRLKKMIVSYFERGLEIHLSSPEELDALHLFLAEEKIKHFKNQVE